MPADTTTNQGENVKDESQVPSLSGQPPVTQPTSDQTGPVPVGPTVTDIASDTSSVITGSQSDQRAGNGKKRKRIIATILAIVLLVGGVATGVYLVQQQQIIRIGAWDCKNYNFNVSPDGVVTATNGSSRNEPQQKAKVFINGNLVATFDVPALDKGNGVTLGTVPVPAGSFSWQVEGTVDCEDSGSYQVTPTPTPSPTPTPTPSPTPTKGPTPTASPSPTPSPTPIPSPTPTLPERIAAQCFEVKAYNPQWVQLSTSDLASLEAGDIVRFTVSGTTSSGTLDKAKFTINGVLRPEVTQKRPGTDEFFDEYTIPVGVTTFTVSAQILHSTLGWF